MPQIVIVAINGTCIGITVDIATARDIRTASVTVFFGLNQIALGVQCDRTT